MSGTQILITSSGEHSLSLSLPLCHSLSLYISPYVFLSLSVNPSLFSVSLCLSPSLSVSISLCISLSLSRFTVCSCRSIKFCRVLQIFYPHSLQTNLDRFPGQSASDCRKDWSVAKYPGSNCTNSRWPDVHGHYREAKYSQTKHHWWWKLNWIFQHLTITKYFTGHVLFIEEDHYLAPDFLLLLDMMKYYQEHTYTEVVASYTSLLTTIVLVTKNSPFRLIF